ncbi:hypothetical protein [Desulfovibrio sp. ZJ200]|uniref:hypothetical protein n=1 Tax=Desulfovibrio sp. ZJ200 TaxID=2709792 RepID=UPI001980D640|nr:hypothetical protein [Desulfovibrio sp. ZJ200]
MIHHQRERRRPLAAEIKGAQKAVIQSDVGEVVLSRVAAGLVRRGFVASAEDERRRKDLLFLLQKSIGSPERKFFGKTEHHLSLNTCF